MNSGENPPLGTKDWVNLPYKRSSNLVWWGEEEGDDCAIRKGRAKGIKFKGKSRDMWEGKGGRVDSKGKGSPLSC